MVSGPMRTILWALGAVGMAWVIVWLIALGTMGSMMWGPGMMGGGRPGVGTASGAMVGGATALAGGGTLLQLVGMVGLAGIFVYLVVDTLRDRSASGGPNVPQ